MIVCIKENCLDKNAVEYNNIEDLCEIYHLVEIDEQYSDCQYQDFDFVYDMFTFNVEKYNLRKQKEFNNERIEDLICLLRDTDYNVLKWKEGELTDEEFEPIRQQRKIWREEIRILGG